MKAIIDDGTILSLEKVEAIHMNRSDVTHSAFTFTSNSLLRM